MKICLLHYSVPPVVGGVESVIGQQARWMAAAGQEVILLAGKGEPQEGQVRVVLEPLLGSRHPEILGLKAGLDRGVVPAEFERMVERIEAVLRAELAGCEVLIAHNVASLHKNLALTAALHRFCARPGAPALILWHHDLAWTTERYRSELHPGYPWDLLRQDWLGATQVVVSELRRRELAALYGIALERVQVVPNGVDPASFYKLEGLTAALTADLGLLERSPLLLLPVRITPRKNIELALRALAALRKRMPEAGLVITGPLGPHNPANERYFATLTALRAELGLEDRAYFLAELSGGYLPDAVIFDFYRLADALFLPSREEGFGIPILEAGLAGIPVFCTDIDPLRQLGGQNAYYFTPDADPEGLALLVATKIGANPAYHLRCRVRREYTWERIYRRQIAPLLEKVKGK